MSEAKINSPYAPYINSKVFGSPDLSRLLIFDTTLRDGEQTPGAAQGPNEKAHLSRFIYDLGVDAMEVSFGISDPKEITATHKVIHAIGQRDDIPSNGKDVVVYSLSRALEADVDAAFRAVQSARLPGIHTFVSTSDEHRRAKFPGKSRDEIKKMLADSAALAAQKIVSIGKFGMVEVSAEDALRTPTEYLVEVYTEVMERISPYFGKIGFTFNIPDTVGVVVNPKSYVCHMEQLRKHVPKMDRIILSAHIHNDHGLAVASSMRAVEEQGVRQIEATVNGIGERAGNTSLEQIAIIVAHDTEGTYGVHTGIDTKKIFTTSVEVAAFTGYHPGRNQPVVGSNTRAHEAGIHQHGQIKGSSAGNARVYEGVTSDEIGAEGSRYPLGRRSGVHAIQYHLQLLGYELNIKGDVWDQAESAKVYHEYIRHAQKARSVSHRELKDIMGALGFETHVKIPLQYKSHSYLVSSDNDKIGVLVNLSIDERATQAYQGTGDGTVEAIVDAMTKAIGQEAIFKTWTGGSRTTLTAAGQRAYARSEIKLIDPGGRFITGEGYHVDTPASAAVSFANAWNLDLLTQKKEKRLG